MNHFLEVKTADLAGLSLDWAMAEAEGLKNKRVADDNLGGKVLIILNHGQRKPLGAGNRYSKVEITYSWLGLVKETREIVLGWAYEPTMCWAIHREYRVSLIAPPIEGGEWAARLGSSVMWGGNLGVIICRAIVAAKLGDVVQVPAEMVGVGA